MATVKLTVKSTPRNRCMKLTVKQLTQSTVSMVKLTVKRLG